MREPLFGFKRKRSPSVCPDCGLTLRKPVCDKPLGPWHRDCLCGAKLVWSHPGVCNRDHVLPLFRRLPT